MLCIQAQFSVGSSQHEKNHTVSVIRNSPKDTENYMDRMVRVATTAGILQYDMWAATTQLATLTTT